MANTVMLMTEIWNDEQQGELTENPRAFASLDAAKRAVEARISAICDDETGEGEERPTHTWRETNGAWFASLDGERWEIPDGDGEITPVWLWRVAPTVVED